jgi:hypothetical protein
MSEGSSIKIVGGQKKDNADNKSAGPQRAPEEQGKGQDTRVKLPVQLVEEPGHAR